MTQTYDISLLPKQFDFAQDTNSEVLYSGSFGAGKSYALCIKTMLHAQIPGNRVGLCRKTLVSLRKTTLKTLLEGDDMPPVLPPGSYSHNKSEMSIRIKGGGEILYFGLDNPQRVGSLNLGACGVDEGVETSEEDWLMLRGRCRNKRDPHNQLYSATNPGPPGHFLAKRFGITKGHQPVEGASIIHTCSDDNWYLPDSYSQYLDTLQGTHRKRYKDGLWVGFDGLVYEMFSRDIHVRRQPFSFKKECYIAVDEGFTNPAVILPIWLDSDRRAHIPEEFYKTGVPPKQFVREVVELYNKHGALAVICDPSAAGLKADLRDAGLEVIEEVDNAVFDGIKRVQDRLTVQDDGLPRLTIAPGCDNVLTEFECYLWKRDKARTDDTEARKDEVVKAFDHAMDALRYGFAYIDAGTGWMPTSSAGDVRDNYRRLR